MSFLLNPFIYAVGGCSGSIISTTNLQAYYKFEGSLFESSGNGNYATPTNITYTSSGKYSSGATFNGTTAYATMPTKDYSASTAYSISAWIKTTGTTEQHILTRDKLNLTPSTNNRRCWQFRIDATTGVLRVVRFSNNTTVVSNFASTAAVNTGSWVHVAMVFDNTVGSKIYINGVQDGSDVVTTNNNNVADSSPTIGIQEGGTAGAPLYFFNGTMDDVSFFNRALTGAEVSTLASSSCPLNSDCPASIISSTSLATYWKFNGNSNDSSGNNVNGTDTGISYVTSPAKFSQALSASGSSQYTDFGTTQVLQSSTTWSISCWVYPRTVNQAQAIAENYGVNSNGPYRLYVNSTNSTFFASIGGTSDITFATGLATANTWHHLVLVRVSDATSYLYVNGVQYSFGASTHRTSATSHFVVGSRWNQTLGTYPDSYLNGEIDDMAFFQRALSSTEVNNLYNSTCPLKT